MLLAPRGWRVRSLDWRLSQSGFDPSYGKLICLATLMSSDRTKQSCLWMTIYIYIYIWWLIRPMVWIIRDTWVTEDIREIRNKWGTDSYFEYLDKILHLTFITLSNSLVIFELLYVFQLCSHLWRFLPINLRPIAALKLH